VHLPHLQCLCGQVAVQQHDWRPGDIRLVTPQQPRCQLALERAHVRHARRNLPKVSHLSDAMLAACLPSCVATLKISIVSARKG
jgi:hypothetical protein